MQPFHLSPPFLIAHRGHREKGPENTLTAFVAAAQASLPMLELDVQLTQDRQLIVIHDDDLDRTTNGHGPVALQNLSQLKMLDAGSWHGSQYAQERLPTLEEVLRAVAGKILVNIEIKPNAYEPAEPPDDCLSQAYNLVIRLGLLELTLFSSFEPKVLLALSQKPRPPRLGYLMEEPPQELHWRQMKNWGVAYWNQEQSLITPADVEKAKSLGLECLAYTVNDPERMLELAKLGVAGFFTDRPSLLTQALSKKKP